MAITFDRANSCPACIMVIPCAVKRARAASLADSHLLFCQLVVRGHIGSMDSSWRSGLSPIRIKSPRCIAVVTLQVVDAVSGCVVESAFTIVQGAFKKIFKSLMGGFMLPVRKDEIPGRASGLIL
jgi:hypothetical protein